MSLLQHKRAIEPWPHLVLNSISTLHMLLRKCIRPFHLLSDLNFVSEEEILEFYYPILMLTFFDYCHFFFGCLLNL